MKWVAYMEAITDREGQEILKDNITVDEVDNRRHTRNMCYHMIWMKSGD